MPNLSVPAQEKGPTELTDTSETQSDFLKKVVLNCAKLIYLNNYTSLTILTQGKIKVPTKIKNFNMFYFHF